MRADALPAGAADRLAGFADERRTGVLRGTRTFAALYTDTRTLWAQVDGARFDLAQPGVRVERRAVAPFVRRFRVVVDGALAVERFYVGHDFHEWPDTEDVDIFAFIAHRANQRDGVARFTYLWTATQQGRDLLTQAFHDEIEAHVARHRAPPASRE